MSKVQNLLQQAKSLPSQSNVNDLDITSEEVQLALAWVRGEVSLSQVARVLGYGRSNTNAYVTLARALRKAIREAAESNAA